MKKKIFISFFMAIAVVTVSSISRAAIEIRPETTDKTRYEHIDASSAYQICYDLRSYDTTLGTNNLDPHLVLNKDWGAVVYLGSSSYGMPGVSKKSTTGNKSGVMNLADSSWVITSSLYQGLEGKSPSSVENLKKNINTKYVETLPKDFNIESTRGMAIMETYGWYYGTNNNYNLPNEDNPVGIRYRRFPVEGIINGNGTGKSSSYLTFRPVIWN